ncbi:MAG TPA: hypothetical protein VNY04_02025, partial [Chthoniobacterales bacterium]|nr:hypothetical protein [Chthoniobacterales bacterium]
MGLLVHRLLNPLGFAAGQLAVFQGANEAPLRTSYESGVLAPESRVNDLNSEATLCINGSVPAFPVSDKKARALRVRLAALQCSEQDLEESFFKGNGVDLRHRVTGIRIRCCRETSQALNRFLARRLLADE